MASDAHDAAQGGGYSPLWAILVRGHLPTLLRSLAASRAETRKLRADRERARELLRNALPALQAVTGDDDLKVEAYLRMEEK